MADPTQVALAPKVALPLWQLPGIVRNYHTGPERVRDTSGPVALIDVGPRWLIPRVAVITSAQGARDALAASNGSVDKEGLVNRQLRALGDVLVTLPQSSWTARRRTLQPLFTKKHVATFAGHMGAAAEMAAEEWQATGTIDLNRECRRLTLGMLGVSLFGMDIADRADRMEVHGRRVMRYISRRFSRPIRAPRWLPTPARAQFRRNLGAIHAVVDDAVAAIRTGRSRDAELIRLLIDATDPVTGTPLTAREIRDELTEFLVGGHDTTSTTLAYALWAMGRQPDIQAKVAAEAAAIGARRLTVDDVAALPYTVAVIHEALRLCPPAPALSRLAMTDLTVDGYRIPKGTELLIGTYAIHRDPAQWDRPDQFDPDRFDKDRAQGRNRWQFIPFGGGPRSCIGDHFAMLEATLGLATIVKAVRIESLEPRFPLAVPFTMTAGGPIPALVTVRS